MDLLQSVRRAAAEGSIAFEAGGRVRIEGRLYDGAHLTPWITASSKLPCNVATLAFAAQTINDPVSKYVTLREPAGRGAGEG
jgi:hypothetical protein